MTQAAQADVPETPSTAEQAPSATASGAVSHDSANQGIHVGLTSDEIVINGGKPLSGRVEVRGAKNLVTKAMVATLLGRACCAMCPTFLMYVLLQGFSLSTACSLRRVKPRTSGISILRT